MLRVTADTNILVSGINFLGGKPFQILELARTGKISPTVSDAILDEMEDVLRRKFSFSPEESADARRRVRAIARTVVPAVTLDVIREDPPDNCILECAVTAGSDFIVTGTRTCCGSAATTASASCRRPISSISRKHRHENVSPCICSQHGRDRSTARPVYRKRWLLTTTNLRSRALYRPQPIRFRKLKRQFDKVRKPIEIQKLQGAIALKLARMLEVNRSRMNFLEEFQGMIDEYNFGAATLETTFTRLMAFMMRLGDEEKRGIAEQLTEEELAIFDLLTKPNVELTKT